MSYIRGAKFHIKVERPKGQGSSQAKDPWPAQFLESAVNKRIRDNERLLWRANWSVLSRRDDARAKLTNCSVYFMTPLAPPARRRVPSRRLVWLVPMFCVMRTRHEAQAALLRQPGWGREQHLRPPIDLADVLHRRAPLVQVSVYCYLNDVATVNKTQIYVKL